MLTSARLAPPYPVELYQKPERQTEVWHASSLGYCLPRMILDYCGVDTMRMDLSLFLVNVVHNAVQSALANALEQEGLHPDCEFAVADEGLNITGHIDILHDGGLIDVKTASPWLYKKIAEDPEAAYWKLQMESYMRLAERDHCEVVMVDRSMAVGAPKFSVLTYYLNDERWNTILQMIMAGEEAIEEDEMPTRDELTGIQPHVHCDECRSIVGSYCGAYMQVTEFVEAVRDAV